MPFLSVFGHVPLVMGFSQVTRGCSYDEAGRWRCEPMRYAELDVMTPLRRCAFFVPGIYVST